MNERASLGGGGGSSATSLALPGTVAGHLDQPAGKFAPKKGPRRGGGGGGAMFAASSKLMIDLAKGNGAIHDPTVRQDLARMHTLNEIGRYNNLRLKAAKAAGQDIPGMPNLSKLAMSDMMRLSRDLGTRIMGAYGTLHAYDEADRKTLDEATGNPFLAMITELALFAQAPPIYGGTDQIQKNIIGERVLGLPKEPSDDKTRPFSELPKNT
jgi:alkylation response protein AidB-like acyl-CoA dehydrogenase